MAEPGVEPVHLEGVYTVSDNVVARLIEGELVIVPLVGGLGDADDELYTLNETGHAMWGKLDGVRTLRAVAAELDEQFSAAPGVVEADVLGLVAELLHRRFLVAVVGE